MFTKIIRMLCMKAVSGYRYYWRFQAELFSFLLKTGYTYRIYLN